MVRPFGNWSYCSLGLDRRRLAPLNKLASVRPRIASTGTDQRAGVSGFRITVSKYILPLSPISGDMTSIRGFMPAQGTVATALILQPATRAAEQIKESSFSGLTSRLLPESTNERKDLQCRPPKERRLACDADPAVSPRGASQRTMEGKDLHRRKSSPGQQASAAMQVPPHLSMQAVVQMHCT